MDDLQSISSTSDAEPFESSGSEYIPQTPENSVAVAEAETEEKRQKKNCKKITDFFIIEKDPGSKKKTDKQGKCTLCTAKTVVIKMKNCGTSALRRHLQSKHRKAYNDFFGLPEETASMASTCKSSGSGRILSWLNNATGNEEGASGTRDNFQQEKFQDLLVEYLVKKYLPFNFFEDKISEKVYKYLNSNVILPGRNQMHSLTLRKFETTQNALKSFLKKHTSKISFTVDGWSSFNMKGYYGITAHFIENWKLQSILLDFLPARGQHTGASIAKLFFGVLQFYELTDVVQGITTDNTNANFTFIRELENFTSNIDLENNHFVCFAHILNLGARDFLKILHSEYEETEYTLSEDSDADGEGSEVVDTGLSSLSPIKKVQSLAKKLKNSEHLRKDFERYCTTVSLKMTMPKLDVVTRWNSTLEMLQWSLSLQKALNILVDNTDNMKMFKLTDTEWFLIKRVCQYLTSFKTISTILEGEVYCTLPMVIIGVNMLLDKLEAWAHDLDNKPERDEVDEKLIRSIQAARDKIVKHYSKTNWVYCVVLILDPRHKTETFSQTNWGKELQADAISHFEYIFRTKYFRPGGPLPSSSRPSANSGTGDFDIDMLSLFKTSANNENESWRYEVDKYTSEPRADSSEDILDWWNRHEYVFPCLALMAKDFLATQATSAPIERHFSRAALTITKSRNRMTDHSIRTLMCLNSWLSKELFQ